MPIRVDKSDEIESPADEIENKIHGVWKELLPSSAFSVTDVFTEVGGTSLLLVDLITKLEVLFRIDWLVTEGIQSDSSVRGMANRMKTRLQRNLKID